MFEEVTISNNMKIKDLSKYACPYEDGIRLKEEEKDLRPSFYRDIDRILYSFAYTRYMDKTQVFTHSGNDHLTKRMTHVQYVSKIARTIGRALRLNEDLIEASALGHDLGHTPFGHVGEAFLNELSLANNEGFFNHNIQSVRLLSFIENHGNGLNLTIPVLDVIMCHNGEFALGKYEPMKKSINAFWKEYEESYNNYEIIQNMKPMTLEGCVVRVSDLIAYLGKDVEDAIRLNIIKIEDVPKDIVNTLGTTNREILNTIIMDIIKNSYDKNYITMSEKIFDSIVKLKAFNYKYIYAKAYTDDERKEIKTMFNKLFYKYLNDLNTNNKDSSIIHSYLNNMNEEYKKNTPARIVIDYIAGMTDDYIIKQYENLKQG